MNKKRGLNKGRVDLLFSKVLETTVVTDADQANHKINKASSKNNNIALQQIQISKLIPSRFQPRKFIKEEELKDLAESIERQGVLQPIVVRTIQGGFEIIAGERRWRAAKIAGLQNIPVIVKELSDSDAMIIALVENIQRENLNPIEEAYALEKLSKECGLTHEETAKAVGKSRTAISNLLRLLNLHADVKSMLERAEIDLGHAKVLLSVDSKQQSKLARIIVEKRLSVRETENLVQQTFNPAKTIQQNSSKPLDPDIAKLQRSLSEKIGATTRILHNLKGNGKIVIKYNSLDELDGILEHIRGQ